LNAGRKEFESKAFSSQITTPLEQAKMQERLSMQNSKRRRKRVLEQGYEPSRNSG
jgi:hypothetical protein